MKGTIHVLVLGMVFGCTSQKPPEEGTGNIRYRTGGNPVIREGSADPSVRVFNSVVYIYPSHDFSRDNEFWIMKDWKVYSSTDLVNFKDHGVVLKGTDLSWASEPDHCWAPDCLEKSGRYYFYFPVSDARGIWKGEIGVAAGDSPGGPFKDALEEPLVRAGDRPPSYEGSFYNIDPAAFTDEDGKSYLFWGNGACFAAELNEDMVSFASEIRLVQIEGHQGYAEGPFVWKRNGRYYLLYSSGGGGSFDRLDYATSGNILGPYRYGGTIVSHGMKGNIHGSVFCYREQWYVAYHDLFPTDKYRKTCLDRIHYRQDGSIPRVPASRTGVGWYNAIEGIEAEDYFEKSPGTEYQDHEDAGFRMHGLKEGDWLRFPNVMLPYDFSGHLTVRASLSGDPGAIILTLDSINGTVAGQVEIAAGGERRLDLYDTEVKPFTGTHDLFLKIRGGESTAMDLDWFKLY
ncbi:MAG: family 43 glycosylhydrolase [Bacteroidales bacterium]